MSATAKAAEFYDEAMTSGEAPAMIPLEDSPWKPLYQEASGWIHAAHEVVDLGCGTGRFLLQSRWDNHYGRHVGVDFSQLALAEAGAYLASHGVDDVELVVEDLERWEPEAERAGNCSYVCLEVLEHLDHDVDLIRRIPPGHQLVLSVPNYESESHVRIFRDLGQVFGRYQHLLAFRRWSLVELGGGKAIHLCDTTRRIDSW